ncbi:carbohydrate ABC transporter permease [Paenibacillus humicola]|uniref:carbohydrate ABC transporter permease n=1 Tax=Paenibacillus humicola TaxID=3110540 RepID=UPI00237AADF9|nr:carbohydrate ABC transporter permease [Paenibacillus humicola]
MTKASRAILGKSILTIIMLSLSVITVMPFLWMLSTSFKLDADVFSFPIQWIPPKVTFQNYRDVWFGEIPFYHFYINSVKVTVISIAGVIATSLMAGYAFAKIQFDGKNVLFLFYLATLMFPDQTLLVPRFIFYKYLDIYNTHWALILPGMISAFGTFLMRQFFMTLPGELSESARIDGAGHFKIFFHIALPLVKPAIVSFLIFSFVWSWNDYENPLIFLSDTERFTIPLGLLTFQDENRTSYTLIMAASVCSLLPIFIIFLAGQKYFVRGIAMTGIKG